MSVKQVVLLLVKIGLASLAFYAGTILGSLLAGALGLPVPPLPAGADAATLMQYQWLTSIVFALTLAVVSRNLAGTFAARFLILSWFSWLVFSVNTYLEAALFTTGAATPFTLVMQFLAVVLGCALVAWLFPPAARATAVKPGLAEFAGQYRLAQWSWRLLLAWIAFPVIYILLGRLAQPFVITYYEQQLAGLTAPGWGEILPVLFLRSLLFLLACLPVLIFWQNSRRHLFFTLGAALFILVGGIYMLQSYWFPLPMRITHSLEILGDSYFYAAALVLLLTKKAGRRERRPSANSAALVEQGPVAGIH